MGLDERVRRDEAAAKNVQSVAREALRDRDSSSESIDLRSGPTDAQLERQAWRDDRGRTLAGIVDRPFHAMMEVMTELRGARGTLEEKSQLWYANETSTTNEVFGTGPDRSNVLAWSHPGVQLALSGKLDEFHDISASGYRLAGVAPLARARFAAVLPEISGLYEPGGPVRPAEQAAPSVGLKAVKLSMTSDQVNAFISRMTGLMLVTGAPGSGKTTVAFQRIRFLYDQQALRTDGARMAPFTVDRTRVFLANANLVAYSRKMLVEQLDIPDRVVELVDPFIDDLLKGFWTFTHGARPRQRRLTTLEEQARRAYFGLCRAEMLETLWRAYERQIGERLAEVSASMWAKLNIGSTAVPLGVCSTIANGESSSSWSTGSSKSLGNKEWNRATRCPQRFAPN